MMKLIKLTKDGKSYYFSSQTIAAKAIKAVQPGIRQAIAKKGIVKGYTAEYSFDNVMTNDVDQLNIE